MKITVDAGSIEYSREPSVNDKTSGYRYCFAFVLFLNDLHLWQTIYNLTPLTIKLINIFVM